MKKGNRELVRIQSVLENDRLSAGDNFFELLMGDLEKILQEFFEYSDAPTLSIDKCGDGYKVNFSITASRLRSFGCLPK
ncbi:MAG: hypothetical protein IJC07_01445 [Clostridia bacterium]|nr:hypothetical protein [Clostridia bacterium]